MATTVSRRSEPLPPSQSLKRVNWQASKQPQRDQQQQHQEQHQQQHQHQQHQQRQHRQQQPKHQQQQQTKQIRSQQPPQPQHSQPPQPHYHNQQLIPQSPVSTRMKRPLGPIDNLTDPIQAKKTRLTVEIFAKPLSPALGPSRPILLKRRLNSTQQPVQVASSHNPDRHSPIATIPLPPTPLSTSAAATAATTTAPAIQPATTTTSATATAATHCSSRAATATATTTTTASSTKVTLATATITTATSKENGLTRHKEKVANGIRHELGRLQPAAADSSTATGLPTGRKLRSQEATRFKSELSAYFPEYDEVIGNDPKEQHILNADTPILVYNSSLSSNPANAAASREFASDTVRTYSDALFGEIDNSQIVNFEYPKIDIDHGELEDALPDSHYAPSHLKAQRLEKSIRNTERGRAQHEKDRIIRLLADLQGHDWLRTMGVSGVTESRKKRFEPARDHFIRGCQAILDKFRLWSQEEKRRKLEKERALVAGPDEDDDEDGEDSDDQDRENVGSGRRSGTGGRDDVVMTDVDAETAGSNANKGGEPPEDSDVEAPARQLIDEAMERMGHTAFHPSQSARNTAPRAVSPPPSKTSFFKSERERQAAMNPDRRRGRTVLAWGLPIPDFPEKDFELPAEMLSEETLRAHERRKRIRRREQKQ